MRLQKSCDLRARIGDGRKGCVCCGSVMLDRFCPTMTDDRLRHKSDSVTLVSAKHVIAVVPSVMFSTRYARRK